MFIPIVKVECKDLGKGIDEKELGLVPLRVVSVSSNKFQIMSKP
jgi:hypothetical protein